MLHLADNRRSRIDIYVPENRKEVLPVAIELSRYLTKVTGARFRITFKAPKKKIVLRLRPELMENYGIAQPKVREVVSWSCDGKTTLEIAGNKIESLWLSVYSFLEEVAGVRWFFPGDLGEEIPKRPTLKLGNMKVIRTPSFIVRDFRYWSPGYQRKKLAGGFCLGAVHAYSKIIPPETIKKHSEYSCLINNQRQKEAHQLCVTNKEVEDLAVQYCIDYFDKNPAETVVSLGANDNNIFCECPKCTSVNLGRSLKAGEKVLPPYWVTRSIFEFSNRVAQRVSRVYPDKYLVVLAYGRTKAPPSRLRIHDQVLVWYCSLVFERLSPLGKEKATREIKEWTRIARNVGIYEYIVNQAWPGFPRPFTRELAASMKFFHRKGVRYFYTQHADDFGMNLPNYYLVNSLSWDVKRDPQKVLDDMYRRCFHQAGPAVRKYYGIMEQAVRKVAQRELGPGNLGVTGSRLPHEQVCVVYPPEVINQAEKALREARRLASEPIVKKRLKIVSDGFELLKMAVKVSRQTFDFEGRYRVPTLDPWAWTVGNYDYNTAVQKFELFGKSCTDDFRKLAKAWKDYNAFRKRLSRTLTLSEFWSRGAKFGIVPLERLENTWKLFTGKINHVPLVVKAKHPVRVI